MLFIVNLNAQLNADSLTIYYDSGEYSKVVNHANNNIKDYSKISDTLNVNYYFKSIDKLANENYNRGQYTKAENYYFEYIRNVKSLYGENTNDYAYSLNELGLCYLRQKKYSEAEPLFINALNIRDRVLGEKHSNTLISMNNLGYLYQKTEGYLQAESLYKQTVQIAKSAYGNDHPKYTSYLDDLATVLYLQGKYDEQILIVFEALEIRKKSLSLDPEAYIRTANSLAYLYSLQGWYAKAEPLYKEVFELLKNNSNKNNDYYTVLQKLAKTYRELYKYKKAEPLYLEVLEYYRSVFGEDHRDYGASLNNLGLLFYAQGKYNAAEPVLIKASEIIKETSGESSSIYATSLDNLAKVYLSKGDFIKAEKLFLKALDITKKIDGNKTYSYAKTLNNLSDLYKKINQPYKQEKLLIESIEIKKETLGENHPLYLKSLVNLALFYRNYGVYEKSNKLYTQTCGKIKTLSGENTINYANCMTGFADINLLQEDYEMAEEKYLKAIAIKNEILGEDNISTTKSLSNLAVVYQYQEKYEESERVFRELLEINSTNDKQEGVDYAVTLGSFASTLYGLEKIEEADKMLLKSVELIGRIEGVNSAYYNQGVLNLTSKYLQQRNFEKANRYAIKSFEYYRNVIREASTFLNSIELLSLKTKLESNRLIPLLILEEFEIQNKEVVIGAYQNELLIKNLTLRNLNKVRMSIETSDDQNLKYIYLNYISNKQFLSKMESLPIEKRDSDYKLILNTTEKLEKELLNLSQPYSENYNFLSIKWKEIKSQLNDGEILVEFINYNEGPSKILSAFLLKKEFDAPKYIFITEENGLKSILNKYNANGLEKAINRKYIHLGFTSIFFEEISMHLNGVKTIYVSPSGMMHKTNFSALQLSDDKVIGEKYEVHVLGSSSELLVLKDFVINKNDNLEFLLYGDIDYDNRETVDSVIPSNINKLDLKDKLYAMRAGSGIVKWSYLAGSDKEINSIKSKSDSFAFKSKIIKGNQATKSSILKLDRKKDNYILHLATHGFFFENPKNELLENKGLINYIENNETSKAYFYKASDDPMLRSGLVFAGANEYWGNSIDTSVIDDGILTAKEISNLDLSACQLVVLSACDTGLGDINGSEGVYGLQRAFKMAGVKNIIMSLWKIPDVQTAELFDLFYEAFFKGNSIHDALRIAQSKMKDKYSPYYWAGFVLLE